MSRPSRTAGIDVGGVEYIVDDRDGRRYFYDINALSNFVADAPRVIGSIRSCGSRTTSRMRWNAPRPRRP
jgi:hypothetical protein